MEMSGMTAAACGFAETLGFAVKILEAGWGGGDNSSLKHGDLGSKSNSAAECLAVLGKVLCLLIRLPGYKMRPFDNQAQALVTLWCQVLVPLEQKRTSPLSCG